MALCPPGIDISLSTTIGFLVGREKQYQIALNCECLLNVSYYDSICALPPTVRCGGIPLPPMHPSWPGLPVEAAGSKLSVAPFRVPLPSPGLWMGEPHLPSLAGDWQVSKSLLHLVYAQSISSTIAIVRIDNRLLYSFNNVKMPLPNEQLVWISPKSRTVERLLENYHFFVGCNIFPLFGCFGAKKSNLVSGQNPWHSFTANLRLFLRCSQWLLCLGGVSSE